MSYNSKQVWHWNSLQRSSDVFMNKAYILAAGRLVEKALLMNNNPKNILDVGAGSGLILKHLSSKAYTGFLYTGIDLNSDGLQILLKRAESLKCKNRVNILENDITVGNQQLVEKFDMI